MKGFLELFFSTLFNEVEKISLDKDPLVDIKIDKQIDYKRYEIIVKNRKMTCISHTKLQTGINYWGIVSKDKYGGILIGNLKKEPDIFQYNFFNSFNISFASLLEIIKKEERYKEFLKTQNHIKNKSSYLYCLENKVFTFPLFIKGEPMLLQFKPNYNEKEIQYYFAFKNFGEFEGSIKENNKVKIKSNNTMINSIGDISVEKSNTLSPICHVKLSILDIKG